MMLPMLLWVSTVSADPAAALSSCVDRKDRACVASLMSKPTGNATPDYLAAAARGYMLLGKTEDALRAITEAVELSPDNYGFLMEQGWLCQRAGDQPAAVHSFLLAARLKPKSPDVFYELGMSFFFGHEYERSGKHFEHTLALDPKNDRAVFMLGILAIWKDQFAEAETRFKEALELRPASADYLLHYGVLLAQLDQYEPAAAEIRKAEAIDHSNPLVHYNLGRVYRRQGKLQDAQRELEEAVKLRPTLASALYQLSGIYRQQGDQAKAQKMMRRFQKQSAEDKTREEDPIDASVSN